jgi:hypothetical protein
VGGFADGGACYIVREVYRPGRDIEWWSDQLLELNEEFPLSWIITDSADGGTGACDVMNKRLGLKAPDGRAAVQPVRKRKVGDKRWGFAAREHVQSLLEQDLIRPHRLVGGPDPDLTEKGVPRSLTDEIPQYVYKRPPEGRELAVAVREEPDPLCADHGCDALINIATTAWGADFTPEEPESGLPDYSYAAVLKHDEVWGEPDPYANTETTFDYTPAAAFIRRRRQ